MSEFKRLLDDPATDDLEADVLRFARREGPSLEARAKILAALGAGAVTAASSTGEAAASQSAQASTSIAPAAAKSGVVLKVLALGAAIAAPLALWFAVSQRGRAPQPVLKPNVVQTQAPAAAPVAVPQAPQPNPAPAVTQLEDLPVLPSAARSAAPSTSNQPSLADEVKAIQRAKAALSAGNASGALKELDAYKQSFPRGSLSQEATVLRIEALAASGNRSAANKLGEAFLKNNEKSPYAARVRSVLAR